MKGRLRWFGFQPHKDDRPVYEAWNKDHDLLGVLSYDDEWRCWVWEQGMDIKMSNGCLKEVSAFISSRKKNKLVDE